MYIVSAETSFSDTDLIIRPTVSAIMVLLATLPILYYIKHFKTVGIVEASTSVSPVLGKVVAFAYLLMCLYLSIRSVSRYDLFASSVMFPETDMSFFILIMLIVCAYISTLGLRALGRASLLYLVALSLMTFVILVGIVSKIDFLNLTPIFNDGISVFVKDCVISTSYAAELALVPLLLPRIKGDTKKPYFLWLVGVTVFITLVSFFVVTVLGTFGNIQLFPSFSISALGKIGAFTRLDAIETSLWIAGIVLKISFYIYICTDTFCKLIPRMERKTSLIIVTSVITLTSIYVSQEATRFSFIISQLLLLAVYIVIIILVPLTVVFGNKVKERRKKNAAAG